MIFPGMDPYLEHPILWPGVHTSIIVYTCNALQPQLRPRYVAAIEERVYLEKQVETRIPDAWIKRRRRPHGDFVANRDSNGGVAIAEADLPIVVKVPELEMHERFITILDMHSEQRIVTYIELASPSNKRRGPGRRSYLKKQREVRRSQAHLVEIDLHRTGQHVLAIPETRARAEGPYDYLASVNRARDLREEFELYPRRLRDRLPRIAIPLAERDQDVMLDVQSLVEKAYDTGAFADRIDYRKPCIPQLTKAQQAWANELFRKAMNRKPRTRSNGSK